MKYLKVTVVGDGAVGKSCLLLSYNARSFPSTYVPTIYTSVQEKIIDGTPILVANFETAGQEVYDRLRPLAYPKTDVFLVCYSVESKDSLENIKEKWIPEIDHYCPEVPRVLVACKTDLWHSMPSTEHMVKKEYGEKVARDLGVPHYTTSALKLEGLDTCMINSFKLGITGKNNRKKGIFRRRKKKVTGPVAPVMPPAVEAPHIEIQTSILADHLAQMFRDAQFTDVEFLVEGKHRIQAHRLILCSASPVFAKILGVSSAIQNAQSQTINSIENYSIDDLNEGVIPGVGAAYYREDNDGIRKLVVEISNDIKASTFLKVMDFLYTGLPTLTKDYPEADLKELVRVAKIFKLDQLETVCYNFGNEEEFLNPSIRTFLNDETAKKVKQLFLNKPEGADVVFNVADTKIFGHKFLLRSRSDVMNAMLCGHFVEAASNMTEVKICGTTPELFLALLEYLYTDHAPIEDSDAVGLLILANEYNVMRLVNLCELYITKEVDKSCSKSIEKMDIDVIGLLLSTQIHNADQLSMFCLHFIASNYIAFKPREEFQLLDGENKNYVETNQWPPLSYLAEVEEYELQMKKSGEKCKIM